MTRYLDASDTTLLTSVARRDRDALGEFFRRYGTVALVAAGWTQDNAAEAEQRTVQVFLDVWARPEAYTPGADSTRSLLVHAALGDASPEAVRLAAARLAHLEGWTYHDVAETLARSARHVAWLIRDQLGELGDRSDTSE